MLSMQVGVILTGPTRISAYLQRVCFDIFYRRFFGNSGLTVEFAATGIFRIRVEF